MYVYVFVYEPRWALFEINQYVLAGQDGRTDKQSNSQDSFATKMCKKNLKFQNKISPPSPQEVSHFPLKISRFEECSEKYVSNMVMFIIFAGFTISPAIHRRPLQITLSVRM